MRVPIEWLKDFVDVKLKPEKLADTLTMSGLEVESIENSGRDAIFEIGVTPNRADCLSITGIAREVAAVTDAKLKKRKINAPKGSGKMAVHIKISVKNPARCPRYSARIIEGVKIGPSPAWMAGRLAAAGVRPINNVVDATNYVMFELGQPLHAFDMRLIRGAKIVINTAGAKTSFGTLDGVERSLLQGDLLISDGQGPVALAGVMGGENSGVRESTENILLESACFEPTGVRRTSKRLGLSSESSRRFERGVDPNGVIVALSRLTELIIQTAGGTPSADIVDIYPKKIRPAKLVIDEAEVLRILGLEISASCIAKIVGSLGFEVAKVAGKKVHVTVPTFRPDILRPIDLIEEVARVNGYDKIPSTMPVKRIEGISRPRFSVEESVVRGALVSLGLTEAVLYGFTSAPKLLPFGKNKLAEVQITNPLSKDQAVMVTTLLPGLLDALSLNLNRQRADCRLFALQRVFCQPPGTLPFKELRSVAGVLCGTRSPGAWEHSRERVDFYDAKGAVEGVLSSLSIADSVIYERGEERNFLTPGSFATVMLAGNRVGFVGELHPDVLAKWDIKDRVFAFELNFEEMAGFAAAGARKFSEYSKFPFAERDIAIVIDEHIPAAQVEKVIGDAGVNFVEKVNVFDVYRGNGVAPGRKSLALTIKFGKNDGTLTDLEVAGAHEKIVDVLKQKLGAGLRV